MKTGTILSCFCFLLVCTGLSAQTNIAPLATCSTSYVSSWETLTAINDGFEPSSSSDKTHGAYGNWQSGVTNTWNWVQYTFKDYYKIARSDVYWWADGQGIVLPYSCKMMYYHPGLKTWVNVANPAGLGLDPDKYDTTTFDTILTNQIRLYFVSTVAQGILEWKVYGEKGEQIPSSSYASLAKLAKNDTIPITVRAVASTGKAVAGYQFKADVNITDNVKQTKEAYVVNGETLTETVKGLLLPPTGATGLTTFNVVLPADIDPTDGIE
ncbi:MAG: hypothetical protein Q8914_06640, partial [Bacteroidota bacterium]|nr:hypothetical protein [Bacteroidota bacterium]